MNGISITNVPEMVQKFGLAEGQRVFMSRDGTLTFVAFEWKGKTYQGYPGKKGLNRSNQPIHKSGIEDAILKYGWKEVLPEPESETAVEEIVTTSEPVVVDSGAVLAESHVVPQNEETPLEIFQRETLVLISEMEAILNDPGLEDDLDFWEAVLKEFEGIEEEAIV